MSDTQRLVFAIIKFLKSQLESGGLSEKSADVIAVSIQCLEDGFKVDESQTSLDIACGLMEIFQKTLADIETEREATPLNKALAQSMKHEGSVYMSAMMYREAWVCFTKAIQLNPHNAEFYCNRAEASNKLKDYQSAATDCRIALKLDPSCSKAYNTLGLARANLNQSIEAIRNYKKALELDPSNVEYKSNLTTAQNYLMSLAAGSSSSQSMPLENPEIGLIFTYSNPMRVLSQMLSELSLEESPEQLSQQLENDVIALAAQIRRQRSQNSGIDGSSGSGQTCGIDGSSGSGQANWSNGSSGSGQSNRSDGSSGSGQDSESDGSSGSGNTNKDPPSNPEEGS